MNTSLDKVFRISIILKGLDALIEIIGGIFVLFVTPHEVQSLVHWLTAKELSEDPHDFIATLLTHGAHHFSTGTSTFASIYLLSHGIIKLFIIINVLRNKYWAYPLLIIVLFAFVIYQVIDIIEKHSIGMVLLSIFDIFIIVLTWLEWQKQRRLREKAEEKAEEQAEKKEELK